MWAEAYDVLSTSVYQPDLNVDNQHPLQFSGPPTPQLDLDPGTLSDK